MSTKASGSQVGVRTVPPTVRALHPAQHTRRKNGGANGTVRGTVTESSDTSSTYGTMSRFGGGIHRLPAHRAGDVRMANTYKLLPDRKFPTQEVREIIDGVLQSYLQDCTYDPTSCARLCETLAALIKTRVKDLNVPRFRILSLVSIAQRQGQGLHVASRSLWDSQTDIHISVPYENTTLVCVATLFALYVE